MTESGFNLAPSGDMELENEIRLPLASGRFEFFKVRRYGILQFKKKVASEYSGDLFTLSALQKEFNIGFALNHPNIVRYTFFEGDALYEEFVDGERLAELLERNDEALKGKNFAEKIATQLLSALDHIHSHGILHLDLKPENVLITRVGNNVKIVDFGCAANSEFDGSAGFTEEFMAPEQSDACDLQPTASTDVYLAGNIISKLAERSGRQRKWRKFLKKALAPDPSGRFQSAAEALKALPKAHDKRTSQQWLPLALIVLISTFLLLWIGNRGQQAPRETVHDTIFLTTSADSINAYPSATMEGVETVSSPMNMGIGGKSPAENAEGKIRKKIEDFISNYYRTHVFPICKDTALYQDGLYNYEFRKKLEGAMTNAENESMKLAETLSREYPDKRIFIETQVNQVLMNQNYILNNRLSH